MIASAVFTELFLNRYLSYNLFYAICAFSKEKRREKVESGHITRWCQKSA